MNKRMISFVLTVCAVAALFAGCSDSSAASSAAASTSAPASEAPAPSAAASSDDSDAQVIKVCALAAYPPFSYLDANGNPAGYDVEALKAVDEKLPQYKFDISIVNLDSEMVGLQSGKYAAAPGFMKTEAREKNYIFTDMPMDYSLVNLVVRKDDDSIKTVEDLVGKKVVPVSYSDAISKVVLDYNAAHPDKTIKLENVDGFYGAEGMKGVASGRWDAQLLPGITFNSVQEELKLDLKITDPVSSNPLCFLLNKKQTQLRDDMDKVIKELMEDGTLSKLALQWQKVDVITSGQKAASSK